MSKWTSIILASSTIGILAIAYAIAFAPTATLAPITGYTTDVTTKIDIPMQLDEARSAGIATVFNDTPTAYSQPLYNFYKYNIQYFSFGDSLFSAKWVPTPSETTKRQGLGPLYNRESCSGCHVRDGRGRPPESEEEPFNSMIFHLSIPGADKHGAPIPHPVYGAQFHDKSVPGVPKEGTPKVIYEEIPGSYGDGTPYSLRKPTYSFTDLGYGPLGDNIMYSPRVAPPVFGLGLLESVEADTILEYADPDDEDGDGISGKASYVWDLEAHAKQLGRFGWKASMPTLDMQVGKAMQEDMGLTSELYKTETCTQTQAECNAKKHTGDYTEVQPIHYTLMVDYITALAPPARRNVKDPQVIRGEKIFSDAGCASCHRPSLRTTDASHVPGRIYHFIELSRHTLKPYSDLLLHDMGEELSDNRPVFNAQGNEWRTPPLWGIGLSKTVNNHEYFLHDGRARGLAEAILWHGGEGEAAKERFRLMSKEDREALLSFLQSL